MSILRETDWNVDVFAVDVLERFAGNLFEISTWFLREKSWEKAAREDVSVGRWKYDEYVNEKCIAMYED